MAAPNGYQSALSVPLQPNHTINTINLNSWHPLGYIPSKYRSDRGFPKTFWLQWNSSNKGHITFQKHKETRLICMTKVPSTRTLLQLFSVSSEKKIISPIPEWRGARRKAIERKETLWAQKREAGREEDIIWSVTSARAGSPAIAVTRAGCGRAGAVLYCANHFSGPESTPSTLRTK